LEVKVRPVEGGEEVAVIVVVVGWKE